jgi:N-hydroxyarylamine O-acetyltransferase
MNDFARQRTTVDLDAYFARIGYSGPREPTLATLGALHRLHPAAIPFENLDVLVGRPIDLAPSAVDAKLIERRRGGFCYEHNSLFKRVLESLGFAVEGLSARVRWMEEPGTPPRPPTHMALRVTIEGRPWLADVGFGGCVPTAPLRLDTREPQPTDYETYRVVPIDDGQRVEALIGADWQPLYEFRPHAVADADYELGNWYVCTHPQSRFRTTLMVTLATAEARYALRNNSLTVRSRMGGTEELTLSAGDIGSLLASRFGIDPRPEWEPVLLKAAAAG